MTKTSIPPPPFEHTAPLAYALWFLILIDKIIPERSKHLSADTPASFIKLANVWSRGHIFDFFYESTFLQTHISKAKFQGKVQGRRNCSHPRFKNLTIFNIICWVAGSMRQTTHWPSV